MQIYIFSFLLFVSSLKYVFIYLMLGGGGVWAQFTKVPCLLRWVPKSTSAHQAWHWVPFLCHHLPVLSFILGTWSALLCSLGWSHTHKRLFLLHFLGNSFCFLSPQSFGTWGPLQLCFSFEEPPCSLVLSVISGLTPIFLPLEHDSSIFPKSFGCFCYEMM